MPTDPTITRDRIYRAVDIRIHTDERVMKLSKPPPSGKGLWYELLFGEQTTIIPGLFKIGEAAFAEQLGWSLKAFRDCWKEVQDAGLVVRADWSARLVWVPNALRHNAPRNPNQILHWRRTWELLPECRLKQEAKQFIEQFLKQFKDSFAEQFAKVSAGTPGLCSSREPCNQEAVSSKQEDPVDRSKSGESEGRELTACESVDNSTLEGLTEAQKTEVQRLLKANRPTEAIALIASLRATGDKTRPTGATA
jgi:hypothetical protein